MLRRYIAALLVATSLAATFVFAPATYALDVTCQSDIPGQCDMIKGANLKKGVWDIISFALGILGGVAVIVIIIAGIMYTTSSGDSGKITAAKNTIIYAAVGLVVAILAGAIVSLVATQFK